MANIFVIGASAGGIEALRTVVGGFPRKLQAAVFVVVHLSPSSPSLLPQVLNSAGPLHASAAEDGGLIEPSRIYVAPPDQHLLVENGRVRVVRGPRENHHRPAVDPLFRTAARVYGPRVAAVILTGMLDDGAAGLQVVRSCGGTVIVQDPDDAMFPFMPLNALRVVQADYVLPARDIAPTLRSLIREEWVPAGKSTVKSDEGIALQKRKHQ